MKALWGIITQRVGLELWCSKPQKANSEKKDVESFKTNQFV